MKKIKLLSCLLILGALVGCNSASNIKNIDELNTSSDIVTPVTFTLSVEATNGTVEGNKEHYAYGEVATLSATPDYGYKFVAWQLNGTVLGEDTTLNYTVIADKTITAVFLPQTITYAFVEENETTYLSSDFFTAPIDIIGRMPYDVVGKIVQGWSEAELVGDQFIVYAVYTDDLSLVRTVTIDDRVQTVLYGSEVIAHADLSDFTHWRDLDGNIISYDRTYQFRATSNITIRQSSLYLPMSTLSVPQLTVNGSDFTNSTLTYDMTVSFDLEKIVDIGVVMSNNPNFTSTAGLYKYSAEAISTQGQFIMIISGINVEKYNIHAKGYVQYFDESGNVQEVLTGAKTIVDSLQPDSTGGNFDYELKWTTGTRFYNDNHFYFIPEFLATGSVSGYNSINNYVFANISPNTGGYDKNIQASPLVVDGTVSIQVYAQNGKNAKFQMSCTFTSSDKKIYYCEFEYNGSSFSRIPVSADPLPAARTAAKTAINTFINSYLTKSLFTTQELSVVDYNNAIDAAISEKEIGVIAASAGKGLAKLELQRFAEAKGANNYSEGNWETLQARVTNGIKNIQEAVKLTDVQTVLTTSKASVNEVVQDNTPLYHAKVDACANLDAFVATLNSDDYSSSNWNNLNALVTTWKSTINSSTTVELVESAFNSAVEAIGNVPVKNEQLDLIKENAKLELDTYYNDIKNNYTSSNLQIIQGIISQAKLDIDLLSDLSTAMSDVTGIINQAKDDISAVPENLGTKITYVETQVYGGVNDYNYRLWTDNLPSSVTLSQITVTMVINDSTTIVFSNSAGSGSDNYIREYGPRGATIQLTLFTKNYPFNPSDKKVLITIKVVNSSGEPAYYSKILFTNGNVSYPN